MRAKRSAAIGLFVLAASAHGATNTIVTLAEDGRCSDYTEYYMKEPTEETA